MGQNQLDARSGWTVLWIRISMMPGQFGQCPFGQNQHNARSVWTVVDQNQHDGRSVWTVSFGSESACQVSQDIVLWVRISMMLMGQNQHDAR